MSGKDAEHPFFRPLWRRIALVAFCATWAFWELYNGQTTWAVIVGAIAVYAVWTFLIDFDRKRAAPDEAAPDDAAPDEAATGRKENG